MVKNNQEERRKNREDVKEFCLFGYGDAGLLVFLFSYLSLTLWGGGGLSGWQRDYALLMLGLPMLCGSLYLGYRGRRQPSGRAVLLLAGMYGSMMILLIVFRVFGISF